MTDLLLLEEESDYRIWWKNNVARRANLPIIGIGGIPITISRDIFDHACYESSHRDGRKDIFSPNRAQRINKIIPMIESNSSEQYLHLCGYDKMRKTSTSASMVIVDQQDSFIVVLSFYRSGKRNAYHIKGEFRTCYVADNSINKILKARTWKYSQCCAEFGF